MNKARMSFELHKVLREIQIHGTDCIFLRKKVDKYGEPTKEEPEEITSVRGLFHVSKGYITQNIQEGTKTHSKGQPKLMVAYDKTKEVKTDDFLFMNGNKYKVVEKNNIQECNIVTDISLELVLDGKN